MRTITRNGANLTDAADQLDLANLVYLGSDLRHDDKYPVFERFAGVAPGNNLVQRHLPQRRRPICPASAYG